MANVKRIHDGLSKQLRHYYRNKAKGVCVDCQGETDHLRVRCNRCLDLRNAAEDARDGPKVRRPSHRRRTTQPKAEETAPAGPFTVEQWVANLKKVNKCPKTKLNSWIAR